MVKLEFFEPTERYRGRGPHIVGIITNGIDRWFMIAKLFFVYQVNQGYSSCNT